MPNSYAFCLPRDDHIKSFCLLRVSRTITFLWLDAGSRKNKEMKWLYNAKKKQRPIDHWDLQQTSQFETVYWFCKTSLPYYPREINIGIAKYIGIASESM